MKISGRYGTVNVDLTCSFCCDFEFSCLVLHRSVRQLMHVNLHWLDLPERVTDHTDTASVSGA